MRKKSKYKPRPIITDVMAHVKQGFTKANESDNYIMCAIANHSAMHSLIRGVATKDEIKIVCNFSNMAEGLCVLGIGKEFEKEIKKGSDAIVALVEKANSIGRFVANAEQINALNELLEIHDAQMEVATISDIEKSLVLFEKHSISGKAKVLEYKHKEEANA